MTAKEFIKQIYPKARAERYKSGLIEGMQETYYLIWSTYISSEKRRLGEGSTEAKAWKNAEENYERSI